MRVLLVEDDIALAQGLQQSLRREGYSIDCVHDGKSAILAVAAGAVDLVILDLGLPDMDGLQVLRKLKAEAKQLAVLILTARDSSEDKVTGLDFGADDYLVKPFDMAELFARLRVIERRLGTVDSAVIEHNGVILDTKAHLVYLGGEPINFSRREYMIFKSLMENMGRIQSKEQLENKLYEWGEEVASNTIEVHVHHVRKKLPKDFIKTVRGVGYIVSKH
ncbi:response regulator [Thalassotalea sp. G2M2-11]|uniref:response regulator n=1 Tax=Thalassotalea sp. G2M2-11 TaxID=2787627 RepID=UPI0019D17873|nr:response regulator [Thalassotalea sp. G2M2-11]